MVDQDVFIASIGGMNIGKVDVQQEMRCPRCAGRLQELEDVVLWMRKYLYETNERSPLCGPHGSHPHLSLTYDNEHTCPHCSARSRVVIATNSPEAVELFGRKE